MATFQLAGLPSMQVSNQTAGGLGLPAVPQYAERPNTGVMLAQGLGAISERLEAGKQQQAEADFMKSFGQAYAANDRDAMKQLAAAHPEQIERIQKGMGFIDQDRNQAIGQAAMDLRLAAKSGDQSLMASLQKNAPLLGQFGLTPEEAFLSYKQDPQQFDKMTDLIHLHADPNSYFGVRDKQEGRDIDRGKLAETERSNRAGESLTLRGQNISAQNSALDREIRKAELASKTLDRQAQKETDDLRRQELEQKIAANNQKLIDAKEKKTQAQTQAKLALDNSTQQLDRLVQEAKSIRDNPSLWRTTGIPGRFYNFPGSAADDLDAQLESLRSQSGFAVLQAMRDASKTGGALGNVSNFEVQQLQANLGNISGKQSTEAMRKNLDKIIDYAQGAKKRVNDAFKRNYPDFKPAETTKSDNVDSSNISDDELLNKYLPR
ncbi:MULTISPECIES: phage DNA ejection protein [unclassified Arsenophonus]|uniref:phage DNA ejection protein n=1 Tax=unclassified Arsenophonus TaxID=2627083 RepID=UPI0028579E98|nr:phage DNA ejection protein [Arsenophonus sp.]MDR5611157.1 phage DNA ejection protein [Arsenophonus sp.]MDR5615148.1 phage DNA ejection protein [Arsenophonus sp.]